MNEFDAKRETQRIARAVLSEIAPGETELFEIVCAEFFADPEAFNDNRNENQEYVLGSGIEVPSLLATYVLPIVYYIICIFFQEYLKDVANNTNKYIKGKIHNRHMICQKNLNIKCTSDTRKLDPMEIRKDAYIQASRLGLDIEMAEKIADLVAKLAIERYNDIHR
jgi:hypothetical protein